MKVCSIDKCGGAHKAKGFCARHYRRFLAHGDALAGSTAKGAVMEWVKNVALRYDGDECLKWPFARVENGYGRIYHNGRMACAHRYINEIINGPVPSPDHETAHECGKGHEGCVAPKHLSWKTRTENQADRIRHGTDGRGEKHHRAKLTREDISYIREMRGIQTQDSLAAQFSTTQPNISLIQNGVNWSWLDAANDNTKQEMAA